MESIPEQEIAAYQGDGTIFGLFTEKLLFENNFGKYYEVTPNSEEDTRKQRQIDDDVPVRFVEM